MKQKDSNFILFSKIIDKNQVAIGGTDPLMQVIDKNNCKNKIKLLFIKIIFDKIIILSKIIEKNQLTVAMVALTL